MNKKKLRIALVLLIVALGVIFCTFSRNKYLDVDLSDDIHIGVLDEEYEHFISSTSNQDLRYLLDNYHDVSLHIERYKDVQELVQALKKDEIDFLLSSQVIEGLNDAYYCKTFIDYKVAVYTTDSSSKNLTRLLYGSRLGYSDRFIVDSFISGYDSLTVDGYDFKNWSNLHEQLEAKDIDYIMHYDLGDQIELADGEVWYQAKLLNNIEVEAHYYSNDETLIDYYKAWHEKYKADLYDELEYEMSLEKISKDLNDIFTTEEKLYLNALERLEIVVAEDDPPVYLENTGIIVSVSAYLEKVLGIDVHIELVDDIDPLDNKSKLYTHNAFKQVDEETYPLQIDILDSSTLIVGKLSHNYSVVLDDLAFTNIGVISNNNIGTAMRAMYPDIDVVDIDGIDSIIEDLEKETIDYAIMDEYVYQYLLIKYPSENLKILGYYNYNNDFYLSYYDLDENLISILNKALNRMDDSYVLSSALLDTVEKGNNSVERQLMITFIILLSIVTLALLVRVIAFRSEKRRMDYLYNHDSLTQLFNMNGLKNIMKQRGQVYDYCLLIIDINNFRKVNDNLSFDIGTEALIKFKSFIEDGIQAHDYLARHGADEYIVIVRDFDKSKFKALYEQLTQELSTYLMMDMTLSFGVSSYGKHDGLDDVYNEAEQALLKQKETNEAGITYFTDELKVTIEKDIIYGRQIKYAFSNEEIKLHYQPQIDVKTGAVVGLEALARWYHPRDGLLSPYSFLHIIQKEKLIKVFDLYILNQAAKQLSQWEKEDFNIKKLAVNITSMTLADPDFIDDLKEVIKRHDFETSRLCLEITEEYDLFQNDKIMSVLKSIKTLGLSIAIDDFGTGYSSMSYLIKYPCDIIKVDRSLVMNICQKQEDYDLLSGVIEILTTLDKIIVIEGVEEEEQINMISHIKDLVVQGYYYSKPLPLDALEEYMK